MALTDPNVYHVQWLAHSLTHFLMKKQLIVLSIHQYLNEPLFNTTIDKETIVRKFDKSICHYVDERLMNGCTRGACVGIAVSCGEALCLHVDLSQKRAKHSQLITSVPLRVRHWSCQCSTALF